MGFHVCKVDYDCHVCKVGYGCHVYVDFHIHDRHVADFHIHDHHGADFHIHVGPHCTHHERCDPHIPGCHMDWDCSQKRDCRDCETLVHQDKSEWVVWGAGRNGMEAAQTGGQPREDESIV